MDVLRGTIPLFLLFISLKWSYDKLLSTLSTGIRPGTVYNMTKTQDIKTGIDLTITEPIGTIIQHRVHKVKGIITGDYIGGYVVTVEGKDKMLPFNMINLFEIVG